MARYHIDWNVGCSRSYSKTDCLEDFHSDNEVDCGHEYNAQMTDLQAFGTLPPAWTRASWRRAGYGKPRSHY